MVVPYTINAAPASGAGVADSNQVFRLTIYLLAMFGRYAFGLLENFLLLLHFKTI